MDTVSDISKAVEQVEICFIERAVEYLRKLNGIKPIPGYKLELSCIAFGEGYNFLYRQLALTTNGDGGWLELGDAKLRALVIDEIHKNKRLFQETSSLFHITRAYSHDEQGHDEEYV